MIHLFSVTAVRNVITVSTELYLYNLYTYNFHSPNIMYSCSNQSVAVIEYVTSYCQINLHLTVSFVNSISYNTVNLHMLRYAV